MPIATIEEGIEDLRNGRMVILVNEDAPDSDGFFCLAAEKSRLRASIYDAPRPRHYLCHPDRRENSRAMHPMIPEENSRLSGLLCGASFSVNLPGVHGVSAQGRAHTIER